MTANFLTVSTLKTTGESILDHQVLLQRTVGLLWMTKPLPSVVAMAAFSTYFTALHLHQPLHAGGNRWHYDCVGAGQHSVLFVQVRVLLGSFSLILLPHIY